MKLISIVIPIYNSEKTIRRCVDSVLSQTYYDIEVILVDDGSQDNSFRICKEYEMKDSRIKVVHKENGGVSSARNCGIDASEGDYIMFVDADDWIENNAVEKMLSLFSKDNVDISMCSFFRELGDNQITYILEENTFTVSEIIGRDIQGREAILCTIWNKLYRVDLIKNNKIRFAEDIRFGEDFVFNIHVFEHVQCISSTSEPLYHYNCSQENSASNKLYEEYDKYINAMDEALSKLLVNSLKKSANEPLRKEFIGERWGYAFELCLNAKISYKQKTSIIFNWIKAMPKEAYEWERVYKDDMGRLIDQYLKNRKITKKDIKAICVRRKKHSIKKSIIVGVKKVVLRLLKKI